MIQSPSHSTTEHCNTGDQALNPRVFGGHFISKPLQFFVFFLCNAGVTQEAVLGLCHFFVHSSFVFIYLDLSSFQISATDSIFSSRHSTSTSNSNIFRTYFIISPPNLFFCLLFMINTTYLFPFNKARNFSISLRIPFLLVHLGPTLSLLPEYIATSSLSLCPYSSFDICYVFLARI